MATLPLPPDPALVPWLPEATSTSPSVQGEQGVGVGDCAVGKEDVKGGPAVWCCTAEDRDIAAE